jgi:hypothetical protein
MSKPFDSTTIIENGHKLITLPAFEKVQKCKNENNTVQQLLLGRKRETRWREKRQFPAQEESHWYWP